MRPIELTFYSDGVSHHIGDLLDALADRPGVAGVTLVTEGPVSPERLALGWQASVAGRYRHLQAPDRAAIDRHVEASGPDAVHVFHGMRHLRCVTDGLAACLRHRRRFGLMHEPRVREGWRGVLRFAQSWITEGRLRRHGLFVLAIGAHGPAWFRRTGYDPARIFPFAYFVRRTTDGGPPARPESPVRIGYVGRLEEAKGTGDALAAIAHIRSDFTFGIVGTGRLADACRTLAERDPRVTYLGVLPVREVQPHLQTLDVLIQPSRTTDDGWGVVVSEALLNGAAVIASDVVGASACLRAPWRGVAVPVGRPRAIAAAVDRLHADGQFDAEVRGRRAAWADGHLTAAVGADTLLAILRHLIDGAPRPPSFLDR